TPQPIDELQANLDELLVRRVADATQKLETGLRVRAELAERHAAELQVRQAARDAVARVQVIAGLQAELDGALVPRYRRVDRFDAVRPEHAMQHVHAGQDRRLAE